jgi:hypothetical protein
MHKIFIHILRHLLILRVIVIDPGYFQTNKIDSDSFGKANGF